jgi:hypothetical protein
MSEVIPFNKIPDLLAEVRAFEARYPEFFGRPPEMTPEQAVTARAYADALVNGVSADARIKAGRDRRMAACDPSSGRIALGEDPDSWLQ